MLQTAIRPPRPARPGQEPQQVVRPIISEERRARREALRAAFEALRNSPGHCWMCGGEMPLSTWYTHKRSGEDVAPLCRECSASVRERQRHQAALERSYQEARAARIAQNEREWEEWREQQRERRQREREEQDRERDAYREELLAREWAEFDAAHAGDDPLVYACAARDFQRSLGFRHEWAR